MVDKGWIVTRPLVEFARPMVGLEERAAISEVIRNVMRASEQRLTNGGQVAAFEEQFAEWCGGGMGVAVSSCFAALHLCLLAIGIQGKRVVVPALTHVAVANAIEHAGGECVFVDCHPESGNLDPDLIPQNIDLITTVHFLGRPSYMKSLMDVARRRNVEILEDCALALGTSHNGAGKHVGLIGKAGCFSFYPAKHMTTCEGGMILTCDPELAEKTRLLRSFGYGHDRNSGVGVPGLNYRMSELHAAMGLAQLPKQREFLNRRLRNLETLSRALAEFNPIGGSYALSVEVPVSYNRDEIKQEMLSRGIETSVYYPKPVPRHPYYAAKYGDIKCPNADRIAQRTIALSVGPHLSVEHMVLQARVFRESLAATAIKIGARDARLLNRRSRLYRPSSGAAA